MATATTQTELPAASWAIDPIHSSAEFALKYMVSTFRAAFDSLDATLDTTGDVPRLVGSVAPESIRLKDPNFHAHLQGPDFFDTENHPAITFTSTAWRAEGDELLVEGDLTIKGETRPVVARGELTPPHEDPFGGTRLGLHLEAVIDRTQFGVRWNNPLPKGGLALADEVRLIADIALVQA